MIFVDKDTALKMDLNDLRQSVDLLKNEVLNLNKFINVLREEIKDVVTFQHNNSQYWFDKATLFKVEFEKSQELIRKLNEELEITKKNDQISLKDFKKYRDLYDSTLKKLREKENDIVELCRLMSKMKQENKNLNRLLDNQSSPYSGCL